MLKNPEKTKNEVVQWIRDYFAENGPTCSAVVGVSGGKDSSVTAALCAEALGADRVVGVLMPNGVQPDIEDSRELVAAIGIPFVELNIEEAFQGMKHMLEGSEKLAEITGRTELSNDTRINLPPRLRMATLYAVGQMLPNGARVANTCNLSEDYVGYSTKIGEVLGLPEKLVKKTPSDGLSGVGDEEKLGFTYAVLDRYIRTGEIDDLETKEKIDRLHRINLHKLRLMPAFEPEEL